MRQSNLQIALGDRDQTFAWIAHSIAEGTQKPSLFPVDMGRLGCNGRREPSRTGWICATLD